MGSYMTKLSQSLNAKQPVILFLGPKDAGKTSILYRLKLDKFIETIPTYGINIEAIQYNDHQFTVWDIGEHEKPRHNDAKDYYPKAKAIIFVVDSTDKASLDRSKIELDALLKIEVFKNVPLLVLANKQDLDGMEPEEIENRLELWKLDRSTWIEGTSAVTGEGIEEGMDWIVREMGKWKINMLWQKPDTS